MLPDRKSQMKAHNQSMHDVLERGISVIVCCYNSSEVIAPTIAALSKQEVPPEVGYEVILVDNNCTDDTVQLAKNAWRDTCYPLRVVREREPGLIHARKAGVRTARYDIILFVDDDNLLHPDWLRKLHHLYQRMPRLGAIGGYNEAFLRGGKPAWFERYQRIYACGPRAPDSGLNPRKIFGAGLSFRTQVIRSALFSELPLFLVGRTKNMLHRGDDAEISYRCRLMGWDFYYDNSLRLQHHLLPGKVNWQYVCQARKGGGKASIILRIYRNILDDKKQLNFNELAAATFQAWAKFLRNNKVLFQIKKEGSEVSFLFYRLLGITMGLFSYRKTYVDIQKRIVDHFT